MAAGHVSRAACEGPCRPSIGGTVEAQSVPSPVGPRLGCIGLGACRFVFVQRARCALHDAGELREREEMDSQDTGQQSRLRLNPEGGLPNCRDTHIYVHAPSPPLHLSIPKVAGVKRGEVIGQGGGPRRLTATCVRACCPWSPSSSHAGPSLSRGQRRRPPW